MEDNNICVYFHTNNETGVPADSNGDILIK